MDEATKWAQAHLDKYLSYILTNGYKRTLFACMVEAYKAGTKK